MLAPLADVARANTPPGATTLLSGCNVIWGTPAELPDTETEPAGMVVLPTEFVTCRL